MENVVLMTCWQEGQQVVEHELSKACWVPPFKEMEMDGMHDMFCPFGQNKMVLIHGLMDGECDKVQA